MTARRTSPFEPLWRTRVDRRSSKFDMQVPAECRADSQAKQRSGLFLLDLSYLPRFTVKGSDSRGLLLRSGVSVPDRWFEATPLLASPAGPISPGEGCFCARTGEREYWVEGPLELASAPGASVFRREQACLLLFGSALADVLEQVLPSPIEAGLSRLSFTLFARVSCALLPRPDSGSFALELWIDPSYAAYLGEALLVFADEVGGGFVGSEAVRQLGLFPNESRS